MASGHVRRGVRAACSLSVLAMALGTVGCEAPDEVTREQVPPELAGTIDLSGQPNGPVKSASVDWATAGKPGPGGFAGDFARAQSLMLSLATGSYGNHDERVTAALDLGFNVIASIDGAMNGAVAKSAEALAATDVLGRMNVIAVRGTQEAQDWVTDLVGTAPSFQTGPYGDHTLHVGFTRYAEALAPRLFAAVQSSCQGNDKKPLWLTGHSLGAAAATILAHKFKEAGCNVAGVSLFGSPHVGLADWQRAYGRAGLSPITQRWNNADDAMGCLPPGGAWRHVGTENQLDNGNVRLNVNALETKCNEKSLIGKLKNKTKIDQLQPPYSDAARDWFAGLIDLAIVCDRGVVWDDVISLGSCKVLDGTGRLLQVYGIAPADFYGTLAAAYAARADHDTSAYQGGLGNVEFPSGVPGANVHVVVTGSPEAVQQFYDRQVWIAEETQSLICAPDRAPNGEVFCDFWVADGAAARITVNTVEVFYLEPAQSAHFEGCDRIEHETVEDRLLKCVHEVHGDTTIELNLKDYVIVT